MNIRVVLRVVSAIVLVIGVAMLTAVPVSWLRHDPADVTLGLLWSSLISLVAGGLGCLTPAQDRGMHFREGFGIVTFGWIAAAFFGAVPFVWIADLSWVNAVFETMSGFTTTGASILGGEHTPAIEDLPQGLLYWRSLTHWLGGMGIVVLSLAILPLLGVGGMQLYKAEVPGPTSDQLRPRIASSAKILYGAYIVLSVAETPLLMAGGMDWFNAWCHTCGTLATGGFSTYGDSLASTSPYIQWVITIFMFLAGVNFALHLRALTGRPLCYFKDEEFRFYMLLLGLGILSLMAVLFRSGMYASDFFGMLRHTCFTVVSIMTTTGFCTEDFNRWPHYTRAMLVIFMFIGGCGGSTGGGIKVSRILLLLKYAIVQVRKSLFPRSLVNISLNEQRVNESIMQRILGFFFIYVGIFVLVALLVCIIEPNLSSPGWHAPADALPAHEVGVDRKSRLNELRALETAITASVATLCNIGPGLGKVGATGNYAWMSSATKILLTIAMLIGRLEVYTVIVLLLPSFWRH